MRNNLGFERNGTWKRVVGIGLRQEISGVWEVGVTSHNGERSTPICGMLSWLPRQVGCGKFEPSNVIIKNTSWDVHEHPGTQKSLISH